MAEFSPLEELKKDQEEHPERWQDAYNYEGFGKELLQLELARLSEKMNQIQMQKMCVLRELGRIANHEGN